VKLLDGLIRLPKIGDVPAKIHRTFEGELKTVTVSMSCTGKYYASLLFDDGLPEVEIHDLEGYAIAATKNQVFEAILIMMLRSLQAISRAFFMINLPSRVK
jgi:hypothetical protein